MIGIAVISCDDALASNLIQAFNDTSNTLIERCYGFNRGIKIPSMPNSLLDEFAMPMFIAKSFVTTLLPNAFRKLLPRESSSPVDQVVFTMTELRYVIPASSN